MPKRTDIETILIIGSGPIIISQACEFDYSGTQACKALKEEGYRVVLVNSNPATIMTDPEMADATYIEPVTAGAIEQVIAREKPQALLPTLGGQTGLNAAVELAEKGVLKKYGVEMIGAKEDTIRRAEDRELFKQAMTEIGLDLPRGETVATLEQAKAAAGRLGYPLLVRPSFTLGGTGGGVARTEAELTEIVRRGLELSAIRTVLLEESIIGWKEYELEVMRDFRDNVVIVCSIENFDPMGIHTGDSITVAPAQTLTDKEYQRMRDAAIAVMRKIGVETGGSNIQFAINPANGRMVVIEMNPRVSRSSALASKATGFPIAKFAAKLAVGFSLDEIPNDITRETPASFEPTIDYCVVKIPRWTFEKFPGADPELTSYMKSVGEVMAIGRTFQEALQKGLRGLETGRAGLGADGRCDPGENDPEFIRKKLAVPGAERIFYLRHALRAGMSVEEINRLTFIDRWFIENIRRIVKLEEEIRRSPEPSPELLFQAKQYGFSDRQMAFLLKSKEEKIRARRKRRKIIPVYKLVDTCAAEFEAYTPYYYSTYESEDETRASTKPKVMILGGGPNRIGQGIEFDYCCCHAAFALREMGYETIMVNSNPETVSTDYDTSDKLYFEPLTLEDVLNIVDREKPLGVILQLGGQTPLNLARGLSRAKVNVLGTSSDAIDRAEDRKRFQQMLQKLDLLQPPNGCAASVAGARKIAAAIGYPVVVRPSYVLGGRAMEIVYDESMLESFIHEAMAVSEGRPVLIDKFLEDAIEVDVDAVADGLIAVIGGIMEHIEEAGVHSGDSAMVLPPFSLGRKMLEKIRDATRKMALELEVKGLMNVQYAVKGDLLYVLEVNPRASRTVPFVSKAIGVPLAKIAARVMVGKTLAELGFTAEKKIDHVAVKESVFPFNRFPGVDIVLGPEMKSTGEVMGIDHSLGMAYAKSQIAAGQNLPKEGTVFISVKDRDKREAVNLARKLVDLGFRLIASGGTADILRRNDIPVEEIKKLSEGSPNAIDLIKEKEIALIINTPTGKGPKLDEGKIRAQAIIYGVPCITTIPGAWASVNGIEALKRESFGVKSIQEYHRSGA